MTAANSQLPRKDLTEDSPLAFPHYLGPGTRGLTTVLLFRGNLTVSLPGWITSRPIEVFDLINAHAGKTAHLLRPLFASVAYFFEVCQRQGLREIKALAPLDSMVEKVCTVYPGTAAAYASWEPLHDNCLPIARQALLEPVYSCTASVEFIWRVWETALELGADPEEPASCDPASVLNTLKKRAQRLGDPWLLLAECALNRYYMPRSGFAAYATDSEAAVTLLATIGTSIFTYGDYADIDITANSRRETLAFFLFDRIVQPSVKPLTPIAIPAIAQLLNEQVVTLARLRAKCATEAGLLVADNPRPELLRQAVSQSLARMSEEASALMEIDRSTMRSYLANVSENPTVWTTVAGLIGSAISLPGVVTGALALTAFSLLGAGATKASRERRDTLRKSPWSFLYYAQKKLRS